MQSIKTIIFRAVIALLFTLPVYFLLEQNVNKYVVDFKSEALSQKSGNISDINSDSIPELFYFNNISNKQFYLEMWANGSLLGVWTTQGQILNHSVVMDTRKQKKDAKLFFLSEIGNEIFINELTLTIKNKKLAASAKTKLLVKKSVEGGVEILQKKMIDLNDDGENEYVFSIAAALDLRNLVIYDPETETTKKSNTEFMLVTDFLRDPSEQQLIFTTYANGNVSVKNVRKMVDMFHLDTSLYNNFYSDVNSYIGITDSNLKVKEIKMQRSGFTSMYRLSPVKWNNKQKFIGVSTFINQPDSLPQIYLLDEKLKLLRSRPISLPVKEESFTKYKKEIFHVKGDGKADHIYFLGHNDTIYELSEELQFLPVASSTNIGEKSKPEFIDLDNNGQSEMLLCGPQGLEIYQENFKDKIHIETGEFSYLRPERFSKKLKDRTEWQFVTDKNSHITLSYGTNPLYYWKIPLLIASAGIIFSILSVLVYLNGRKIEKENKRLELLVQQRTSEAVAQKEIAEHQRQLIQEKQKEIIDSITYAKYIQKAILAKEKDILQNFPESFLLYVPKDIVAGDFYFFESTPTHVFYAAADCTGHGVPGALVSVICSNALSRCVKEFSLTLPGEILDKAREIVLDTLSKSGEGVKDGMDISFLVKDLQNTNYYWAGANNPVWIFTSNGFREITATKQPIGISENPRPFITHNLHSEKNDTIYLFTDGFADQFGGKKGKKFKYKQLAEKLQSLQDQPLGIQKDHLEKSFYDWKGDLEQVDDVCIIGIKV